MWNTSENQIELTLIRHGRTKGNTEQRYIGRTDEELSEEARADFNNRKYPAADFLFSSPMKRCIHTAEIIYPNQFVNVIKAFREMDFGRYEGKNYLELREDPYYQEWIDSNGMLSFPEGESREEFIYRSIEGFHQMLDSISMLHMDRNKKVTAVVHGGTIMSILAKLDGGDYYNYQVKNLDGYRCMIQSEKGVVKLQKLRRL